MTVGTIPSLALLNQVQLYIFPTTTPIVHCPTPMMTMDLTEHESNNSSPCCVQWGAEVKRSANVTLRVSYHIPLPQYNPT